MQFFSLLFPPDPQLLNVLRGTDSKKANKPTTLPTDLRDDVIRRSEENKEMCVLRFAVQRFSKCLFLLIYGETSPLRYQLDIYFIYLFFILLQVYFIKN
jgi:hypothetical protein